MPEESMITCSWGNHSVTIPNPHGRDISEHFLRDLLKQAGISREEWEKL
jgi:hypothetical protein